MTTPLFTSRLTESQKGQMAEQYRSGSTSGTIAKRFGCSDRTVMRIVRSRLSAAEMASCKAHNRKRPGQVPPTRAPKRTTAAAAQEVPLDGDTDDVGSGHGLPWEDADDFVENEGSDDDGAMEEDSPLPAVRRRNNRNNNGKAKGDDQQGVAVTRAAHLDVTRLPSPLYLLVERSVELQPQTLASLHHLDSLDKEEQQRQGLVLFGNIRQARRQCRRNQRIVKLADPHLLVKTAPHLLAQGISRLVIESVLYALPGSAAS